MCRKVGAALNLSNASLVVSWKASAQRERPRHNLHGTSLPVRLTDMSVLNSEAATATSIDMTSSIMTARAADSSADAVLHGKQL